MASDEVKKKVNQRTRYIPVRILYYSLLYTRLMIDDNVVFPFRNYHHINNKNLTNNLKISMMMINTKLTNRMYMDNSALLELYVFNI